MLKILILLLLINFGYINGCPDNSRGVVVNKFKALVSTYLNDKQYGKIMDDIEPSFYNCDPPTKIGTDLFTSLMANLSPAQYFQIGARGIGLLAKLDAIIDALFTVLGNNLSPVAAQINKVTENYKSRGINKEVVMNKVFCMMKSFMTKKRVNTIMCRVKIFFGNDWKQIHSFVMALKMFQFQIYECTATA